MCADARPPTEPSPGGTSGAVGAWAYIAVLALILASFPERSLGVWGHLAAGRAVVKAGGTPAGTWVCDVSAYLLYAAGGGGLLAATKAVVVAGVGLLVLSLGRLHAGPVLSAACTALALLAVGHRVLLQPATVSYLFFASVAWLVAREGAAGRPGWWPGWRLVVVFVAWANTDRWAVLGLAAVALFWLGRCLDRPAGRPGVLGRLTAVAVLAVACTASPAHVRGLYPPRELTDMYVTPADPGGAVPASPFGRAYVAAFGESPAARAYFVLLGLSGLSFALARPGWRWEAFLPWAGLAVVSAGQGRAVAFFAIVAGPALAWNVARALARRPAPPRGGRLAIRTAAAGGGALLVCAWPGWLQGPPYEPRRWAVDRPAALERAAAVLERWQAEGLSPAGTRTLHPSPEVAGAFAWFGPGDPQVSDPGLVAAVGGAEPGPGHRDRLRAAGVSRVVVPLAARGRDTALLERLLTSPDEWPLLHTADGVAIFGWRDPAGGGDPFAGREEDFDRLAFRPAEDEKAPPAPPPAFARRWWEAFWRPAPGHPPARDEAALLLLKAEAERLSAPRRHARAWEAWHTVAAVAACGLPGPAAPAATALQLTLYAPPPPAAGGALPAVTRTAFDLQQRFAAVRGDVPPGVLYAAVRAGRRAAAENPTDAGTYLVLGQCYLRLSDVTLEKGWAVRFPLLGQIRHIQASAALNRAVALDPALAQARLELALLYRRMNCGDLAVLHMRAYRELAARAGRPPDPAASEEAMDHLDQLLDRHTRALAEEAVRVPAGERARMAAQRGLVGEALRLLLESDVSAFGTQGMRLELDILLKTGRVADVLAWTTPELRGSLGAGPYHLVRAQAYLAAGDYAAADVELGLITDLLLGPAEAARVAGRVAGRGVLEARPGPTTMPNLLWRALSENDYRAETRSLEQTMTNQCDVAAVRGLAALEAGDLGRAREAFRTALAFTPPGDPLGGFSFPARPVAATALGWLDAARSMRK